VSGNKRIQEIMVLWKVIVGAILIVIMAVNLPLYMNGSTEANAGLALSCLVIFGGLYLIYRGLYPTNK
jgi:hypothetical protein